MSARVAFPFLTLSDIAVEASPWSIAQGNGAFEAVSDFLADWDNATPIHLRRSVQIHRDIAAKELEIGEDELTLRAGVAVGTGPGRLPRIIVRQCDFEWNGSNPLLEIELALAGEALSSVLHLRLDILLVRVPGGRSDLSPRRRGDRLWHDSARIRLEGEEPRFPIEVADFRHLLGDSPAAQSPWYLHWAPQWTRDFHGSIRLYLNADHRDMIARVETEDGDTLRFLMADVMGQVCECLVREPDADSIIENCEEGTLGAQAAHWLRQAFPGQAVMEARVVLEKRPGVFRASFQAIAEVKGDDS